MGFSSIKERGKKDFVVFVLHYIRLAPLTGLSGCYCCSGSLREEHSNDLVTVIRKTVSPASFRGEETVKCPQTHTESVRPFQVLHCAYVWTDRMSAHIYGSDSCQPLGSYFISFDEMLGQ